MASKLTLILAFFCAFTFAQTKTVASGTISITTGQKMNFTNLRFIENEQVVFKNKETQSEFYYFLKTVKLIVDSNNNVVYENTSLPKPNPAEAKTTIIEEKKDTLFRPNYPEGIYKTKEDFINKKPSQTTKVFAKGLIGFEKPILTEILHSCFFYDYDSDSKIKNVFAISFKGHLYFQINAILENRNKTDRAQTNELPNSFVRVIMGGENYYYTEADLVNKWAQGLAYGAIGGVTGAVIGNTMYYGKGVVWDFKNKEFNIFKNCEDYNDFLKEVYPKGVQTCPDQQPNIKEVRKVIAKIK